MKGTLRTLIAEALERARAAASCYRGVARDSRGSSRESGHGDLAPTSP